MNADQAGAREGKAGEFQVWHCSCAVGIRRSHRSFYRRTPQGGIEKNVSAFIGGCFGLDRGVLREERTELQAVSARCVDTYALKAKEFP